VNKLGPEELFKTIFERLPLASFSCDAEGVVLDWNEAAERLYGYKRQDAVGCKIVELIATPDSNDEDLIRQVFSGEELRGIKLRRRCADGRRLEVLTTFCPLREAQGKVGRVVLVESKTADFSGAERMRVQEALRESEERFRQLAENIKEVFWLTDWINNKVLYVSPAYEEIWGCSPQSLLDNPRSWIYNIHPDDRDRVYNSFKQNAEIGLYDEIYRVVPKDGEIRWIHDRAFPIHDETGRVWRVVGISADITDIKRAEEALRESHERFLTVLDSLDSGVYVADMETYEILFANQKMRNYFGNIEGKTCWQVLQQGQSGPCDFCTNDKLLGAEGEPTGVYAWEFQNTINGFWCEIRDRAIRWVDGRMVRLEIAMDITERKRAEEELQTRTYDLGERVKELNCLYGVLKLMSEPTRSLEEIFQRVVRLIPPSWQYPDIACARITFEGRQFKTDNFNETAWKQSADIRVSGEKVGSVDVCYLQERPAAHEGPFLKEEMVLINALAGEIGVFTERKRATEALRESEKKYHQLVDSLHEGIWVIDKDSFTTFVNPRMAQMLGYTPDEMQGKHLFSFMDERGVQICKRYLERRRQGIKEQHEFEFLKKDGTRIYALLETSPITDDDGGYMGAVAGVLDITERKRAEEALRESEELYRTLVNSAEEGIGLVDAEERFLFVNPKIANLVGYDQEELIGRSLLDLVPSEEVEFIRSESRRRMKGETSRYETTLIHKNGTPRKVLVNAAPIYDAEGQLYATLGVLTDITDLKKVEDELRLRLIYQTAFAQIMNRAIGIENLDTFIQACLEILGNALDASRVYLATDREVSKQREEVHPSAPKEGPGAHVTHEWLGQGAETLLGTDYSYSKIGYIHKHLKDDEAIAALVSSLPEADSRVFRDQGALSVILAPLRLRNGFYGFIVAEEYRVARQWSNSETEAFRTAARLIGTVIDRYFEEQERRVAEEARAQSEQRYRTLVETSSDIIFLLSPSGKPLYGSPAIERMGYKPEDILREPKAFLKAIAPDDFMMLQSLFAKALREGKPIHDIDCKVYDSQGSSHWFAVSWNFIRDDEGRILAVQGVARDITERKQAERALRLRMEYEKVLFEISSLFLSEGVSDSSLGEFLERLARVTEVSRVYLFFHEEENTRPFMKHIHRWVSEEASELDNDRMDKVYYDQGFERWLKILSTGEAIHGLTDDLPASEREVFEAEGILAILVLPIFVEGRFWGAIGFDEVKRRREWNVEDIRLLWTASKILSSALATESKARELALSYENLQERERRISELNLRLVKAEEDERRRIARVLHDEIAQQLTGVSLVLSAPELTRESRAKERLDEAKGLVKETQNFIRDLSYELLPPALENLGLAAAVRALARSAAEGSGVSFVIQGDEGFPRADPDTEIMLYRVIQEAVTNALKHAEPDEITVRFEYAEPKLRVMVEDDGKGFDVEKVASASSGLGLRSIHERVALIGGRIELNSSVGKGTQVLIEVEIPRNSDKLSVEE